MRKISLWLFIFVFTIFTAGVSRAQDAATQQQIDKLSGQIQDLLDAQAAQAKRIDALAKRISDLGDKLNQPDANNFASADDLKKLAAQVQEIDKKRQDDNDLILKQLEKLAKVSGGTGSHHTSAPAISTTTADNSSLATSGPQKGYDYTIASGDTISAIAKAYRAQGVKVTSDQILKANPGLNANSLIVGKKIFIPDANAK
jgi:LysM repeat protein